MGRMEVPAVGAAGEGKEAQPEPSLVGDAASGASREDSSGSETEGEVGAGEIEEEEDLFASGSEDHGGDAGTKGKDDAPANMADQQEDNFAFPDKE